MKSMGMIRKIDELGRIVLPMELRKTYGLKVKDSIEIFTQKDSIVLKKYEPFCVFCGSSEDLTEFKDKKVCKSCINSLKK